MNDQPGKPQAGACFTRMHTEQTETHADNKSLLCFLREGAVSSVQIRVKQPPA